MRHVLTLLLSVWMATSAAAQSPVVVELFTSQGCSSCPPADKLFHKLAERDDVIALGLHVDYWDYIGWKDQFANPAHSDRQRAYAMEAGRRSVYTPQMVVNGTTDIVGTRPMELSAAISAHAAQPSPVSVNLSRDGAGAVSVSARAIGLSGPLVVQMVRYTPLRQSKITRGENAGHTLNYANVTDDWMVLGEWNGATPFSMKVPVDGDRPVVVLVQQGLYGAIVGAARLR